MAESKIVGRYIDFKAYYPTTGDFKNCTGLVLDKVVENSTTAYLVEVENGLLVLVYLNSLIRINYDKE